MRPTLFAAWISCSILSQMEGKVRKGDSPIPGIKARVIIIEDTGIKIIRKYEKNYSNKLANSDDGHVL